MVVFIRDQVARPAIGQHDADKFVPLLLTFFFFILGLTLAGMVPWVGAPTGAWGVTFALAVVTFGTVIIFGMLRFGPVGFFANQVPSMDLPFPLGYVIKPVILAIELLGLVIKHVVLSVRLLANMVAGHLVLLAILLMAFSAQGAASSAWPVAAVISVLGTTAFSLLELFVAFLQAYIFTFLSALFIGAAVHHH
jgi:F-type H+-transporting ATPase subunit a